MSLDYKSILYPGTFDPVTLGHQDLIDRACQIGNSVTVAVAASERKKPMFTLEERVEMLQNIYADNPIVKVRGYSSQLTVDLLRNENTGTLLRGVRASGDFEYELQLVYMNKAMFPEHETLFLVPKMEYSFISSTLVREIGTMNGDITPFVHEIVADKIRQKVGAKT